MIRAIAVVLAVTSFSLAHAEETLGFRLANDARDTDLRVTVTDEQGGATLPGAKVVVGERLDDSTAPQGLTDAAGAVVFPGLMAEARVRPRAVTVSREGYVAVSLVGVAASRVSIALRPLPTDFREVFAGGSMGSWKIDHGRSIVSMGLVFKSLSAFSLVNFSASSFISPVEDTVDIYGPRQIPSNLVLPKQTITVVIAPVTLNKPLYRLPLARATDARLVSIRGQAPVKALVKGTTATNVELNAVTISLLNDIQFKEYGLSAPVTRPDADFRQDVPSIGRLAPAVTVASMAPPFDADVALVSFTDLAGDRSTLFPTDVKVSRVAGATTDPRPVKLAFPEQATPEARRHVLSLAILADGSKASGVISANVGPTVAARPFLMPPALAPEQKLPDAVPVSAATAESGKGLGIAVFEATDASLQARSHPVWYVIALPGAGTVQVPTRALPVRDAIARYSSGVLEFDAAIDEHEADGPQLLKTLSRFARTMVTLP